jgi:hypothetical protein
MSGNIDATVIASSTASSPAIWRPRTSERWRKRASLVLTRYNIFELARRACLSMPAKPSQSVTLKPGAHFYNPYELRRLVRRIPRIPGKVRRLIRGLHPYPLCRPQRSAALG